MCTGPAASTKFFGTSKLTEWSRFTKEEAYNKSRIKLFAGDRRWHGNLQSVKERRTMKGSVRLLILLALGLGICSPRGAAQGRAGAAASAPAAIDQRARTALQLLKQGHEEEAVKLLVEGLRQDPSNQPMNALLAQVSFSRKDYGRAAAHYGKSPAVLTANPLLTVNYAEALFQTKSPDAAKRVLESLPVDRAGAQFEAGLLLARFGEFLAAEEHFKLARKSYPKPEIAAYNLGLAQYSAGKFAEAVSTLEDMRRHGPVDEDALNLLGEAYVETGQPQKALDTLKEAIQRDPRDERNYIAVAKLAVDQDLAAIGLELLDQGLGYLPQSYPLLMQRGYLRLSQGQYTAAESDYRKAMQLQPASDSAKIGLAFVFLESQRQTEAEALLRQAIQSGPPNFFAQYLLGELQIREGLNDEAAKHLQQSIALQPRFAPAHTNLGKLYLKKNDPPHAVRELEAAIQLDPEDATAYYQLSIAYRKTGKQEKAQAALEHVKHLNQEQRDLGNTRFLTERLRKLQARGLALF
jgi:tetratricopeptide (TPR) repeat protein